jgi:uncharacterized membrane protein YedE/YeeE
LTFIRYNGYSTAKEQSMFTWLSALAGGALIGLGAALLLLAHGRIAGISGIVAGALGVGDGERSWRLLFLAGFVAGGIVAARVAPHAFAAPRGASATLLIVAGLLVGFGTRLGSGCTSGHGVCGIGRLSWRSLVATATFMATGAATVLVVRHVLP